MDKVGIGVIGLGNTGLANVRIAKRHPRCSFVAGTAQPPPSARPSPPRPADPSGFRSSEERGWIWVFWTI